MAEAEMDTDNCNPVAWASEMHQHENHSKATTSGGTRKDKGKDVGAVQKELDSHKQAGVSKAQPKKEEEWAVVRKH